MTALCAVAEWGHDFRSSYRSLHLLREQFPEVPIVAFTATATVRFASRAAVWLLTHAFLCRLAAARAKGRDCALAPGAPADRQHVVRSRQPVLRWWARSGQLPWPLLTDLATAVCSAPPNHCGEGSDQGTHWCVPHPVWSRSPSAEPASLWHSGDDSCIVYCLRKTDTEAIAAHLVKLGVK